VFGDGAGDEIEKEAGWDADSFWAVFDCGFFGGVFVSGVDTEFDLVLILL